MVQLIALGGFFILGAIAKTQFDKAAHQVKQLGEPVNDATGEVTIMPSRPIDKTVAVSPSANVPTVTYPCLVALSGVYTGRVFRFRADRSILSIGREASNDLQIDDVTASRHHAVIRVSENGITIKDAGSTNGTRLNGSPLVGEAALQLFDKISIGQNVFQLDVVTAVA